MTETRLVKHFWFFCNSCIAVRKTYKGANLREGLNCPKCGLNARHRSVLLVIQLLLLKKKVRGKFQIVGVSDGASMQGAFTRKFPSKYLNFEYHTEPRLDVSDVPVSFESIAQIVTCSEVLEHVEPPVALAFKGLNLLLMKGGYLVLSVPHNIKGVAHVEHFPNLVDSKIESKSGKPVLSGKSLSGEYLEFENLVFHGGAGSTLEYRVFSEDSLRDHLTKAGFVKIRPCKNYRFFGIVWQPWSRVWVAQKPK